MVFHELGKGALCSHIAAELQKNAKYPKIKAKTYLDMTELAVRQIHYTLSVTSAFLVRARAH